MEKNGQSLTGRVIRAGTAKGRILFTDTPLGFFGCIDPETGVVTDRSHPLQGQSVRGRILVFPRAKGSTVGSYTLHALAGNQAAPAAMVLTECESIVAAGAVMGRIPTLDRVDIHALQSWTEAVIDGEEVRRA